MRMGLYLCGAVCICVLMTGCGSREERHYELAMRYKEMGDYEAAIVELQSAIECNPGFAKGYNQLGVLYGKVGLYDKAVEQCTRATELDPGLASAYYNLGVLYQTNYDEPARALEAYSKYLELNPEGTKAEGVTRLVSMLGALPEVRESVDREKETLETQARALEEKGDYAAACELYSKIIDQGPAGSADAHRALGRICDEELGEPQKALTHYGAYLDMNLNAPDAAQIMERVGALRAMVQVTPTAQPRVQDELDRAEQLLANDKAAEAIKTIAGIIERLPEHTRAHELMARAYGATKDYRGAEKEYEWLKAHREEFQWENELRSVYTSLGDALFESGEYRAAAERYEKALELAPESVSLHWKVARTCAMTGDFQNALREARLARRLAPDAVDTIPMAEIYAAHGRNLVERGRFEEAIKSYKRAKELYPKLDLTQDLADLCVRRGTESRKQGKMALAQKDFIRALELDPARRRARAALAELYSETGHYNKALAEYKKLAEGNDRDPEIYRVMARIYEEYKADPATARTYYTRYLEEKPDAADAAAIRDKLAEATREKKQIVEYQRALERRPESAASHYNLAVLLQRQGKLREAIEEYRKAVKLEPDNARAYFNMGYSYDRLGMYDRAIEQYLEAVRKKPDYVKAYNNLAAAYKEKGWYGRAVSAFTRALELDPTYAHAHLGLAALYADDLKDRDKAAYHYRRYLQIQPDGPYSSQVRAWLREMR